jgi:hypothetical protein
MKIPQASKTDAALQERRRFHQNKGTGHQLDAVFSKMIKVFPGPDVHIIVFYQQGENA